MTDSYNKIAYPALLFLAGQQKRNGGFLSLTSGSPNEFTKAQAYRTTFFTANIINSLNSLPDSALAYSIKKKAARFLLFEKSELWSFNYWQRNSAEAKTLPYPDDLDDTFCALSALAGFNPKLINGQALANVAKLLTSTETKPGGPYRTWLVDHEAKKVWQDIDLAVNANVAFFLSLQEIDLPNMGSFFDGLIKNKQISSAYYPDIFPIIYFLSRCYKGKHKNTLIRQLLNVQLADNSWGNPLKTALAVSALINLGYENKKGLNRCVDYINKTFNGKHWPACAFCFDPAQKGKKYYAGSASLTTAFCLEALSKYQHLQKTPVKQADIKVLSTQETKIHKAIIRQVRNKFASLAPDVSIFALESLNKTLERNNGIEIALLPFWFRQAMGAQGKSVTDEQILNLGNANLYGWISYTIYDDFYDGEGNLNFLPAANTGLREVSATYAALLKDNKDFAVVKKILDNIDAANAWESRHCKAVAGNRPDFKNFQQLADKSLGHALGPIAIMMLAGYKAGSKEVKNLLLFFTHYLIARQMNDDAHDWLDDLRAGRINSVGGLILKKYNKFPADLGREEQKLQRLFWRLVIPETANDIFKHTRLARMALNRITAIENSAGLLQLLAKPETASRQALEESTKMKDFFKSY